MENVRGKTCIQFTQNQTKYALKVTRTNPVKVVFEVS